MKKIVLLLSMALMIGALTACGNTNENAENMNATNNMEEATEETMEEGAAKTGLAVISSIDSSTSATAEEDGLAQVNSFVVGVLVDEDGTIIDCAIDMAQTKINFSNEGVITTDLTSEVKSKRQLGEEYGMKAVSEIGKEWYEQADAFAAYVIGKTADEVAGIAVDDAGLAADADLVASVTVHIGDFIEGVEKAVVNAQNLGAASTDMLGLAVSTEITDSSDATADADGLAMAYSTYGVVTVNADGVVTSSYIDMSQGKVNFDATGTITTDLTVGPSTKRELGEDYGLRGASSISKEWFEESDAFSAYVLGKTADEVAGIAIDEEGHAADADLVSSVTVHVSPFVSIVSAAIENATK